MVQFYPKKKFLLLYSNMEAPNMNDRLHLTDDYQNSPASSLYRGSVINDCYQELYIDFI